MRPLYKKDLGLGRSCRGYDLALLCFAIMRHLYMNPEQWQRIADLYELALAREPENRSVFLREVCGEDEDLQQEVESLLRQNVGCDGVLERIAEYVRFSEAVDRSASVLSPRPLPALIDSHPDGGSFLKSSGRSFGPYELKAQLGVGGMGEVYRAWDSELKRDVAVKVLPTLFSRDAERVARFQREAEVLASLNHPHIAAIYDLEKFGDLRFLVLELVEGETLADRLVRGPIAIREALPIAMQIAEALEAAHEKGIVHRDLKPANVKITPEGKVKVLDFGLAKPIECSAANSDFLYSPTLMSGSMPGVIMGTAAYMSPEQACGKKVDRAADIWAFGCVLYEMLTGKQPFTGETLPDVLDRIVTIDLDWTALPEMTPPIIRSLLRRLMQKDPNRRLHDIADARIEIEEAQSVPLGDNAAPPARRVGIAWIAAALALASAGLLTVPAVRYLRETRRSEYASHQRSGFLRHLARRPAFGFRCLQRRQVPTLGPALGFARRNAAGRNGRRILSILVPRQCFSGILCRCQVETRGHRGRRAPGGGQRHKRTRRHLESRRNYRVRSGS